jgi:hypothetical protein
MERTPEANGGNEATPASRKSKQPLYLRLYFRRHMVEIVRMFGHASIPIEQAREQLRPLVETYGKTAMEDAAEEILFIDDSQSPAIVRLTDEARQLAIPLIGRLPEHRNAESPSAAVCHPTVMTPPTEPAPTESAPVPISPASQAPARKRRSKPGRKRPAKRDSR